MGRNRSYSRSRSRSRTPTGTRVHVGDLPSEVGKRDIEKEFGKFGPLLEVWLARTPPCFGFVVFENSEDAHDCVDAMNGSMFDGHRIRVSIALPRAKDRSRRVNTFNDFRCYQCGERGHFSRDCDRIGRNRNRRSTSRDRRNRPNRRSRSRSGRGGRGSYRSRSRSRDNRRRDNTNDRSPSRNGSIERKAKENDDSN